MASAECKCSARACLRVRATRPDPVHLHSFSALGASRNSGPHGGNALFDCPLWRCGNWWGDSGRLPCVMTDDAWRRTRTALLRSLRIVIWPITWPLWKVSRAWVRRDPKIAAAFHDLEAARNSRTLGPYHRATLRAQADHAIALSKLGELQQAEAELTEVIIRLNPLDDGDAQLLLDVRCWHHHVLVRLGWVSESEADARFAAESYARQFGPDHPDTLHWRQMTAAALWNAGRHDEAIAEVAGIAARRTSTQGATHPDTLQAEQMLSAMRSDDNVRLNLRFPAE